MSQRGRIGEQVTFKMDPKWSSFIVLLLLLAVAGGSRAEIVGCGGFIEASPALLSARGTTTPKLDYSFMSVELVSPLGVVKERTECSPNGYYFIPVEEKGSYALRVVGPDGWTFEPDSANVEVGTTCGEEEYVNFEITGFSLSGSVLSAAGGKSCPQSNGAGPEGVTITLTHPSGSRSTAVTDSSGQYRFANLSPGEYTVSASHPTWKLDGSARKVTVEWGNAKVADDFRVSGYDLSGSVVADGNPILGVQVFLYSDEFSALPSTAPPSKKGPKDQALSVATSKEDGTFIFSGLPCGAYELVPFYKGDQTVFDVSPLELNVVVRHGGATLEEPFHVTGFSVSGKVLNDLGEGIPGAKIVINGTDAGVTSADGRYSIDKVSSSSKYTIEVSKAHHSFPPLKSVTILPSMATLPDIIADAYDLCGIVIAPEQATSSNRQVALTHGPPRVGPKMAQVDTRSGRYCFSVPAGEYLVSPMVSSQEKAAGVLFTPPQKEVKLSGAPLLNVDFTPTKVTVSGHIKCLSPPCGDSVTVSLTPIETPAPAQTEKLQANDADGRFVFLEVIPGKYRVSVKTPEPWCWADKGEKVIDVGAEDLDGLELKQSKFTLKIDSSHDVEGMIELLGGSSSDTLQLSVRKGTQEVYLSKPGVYSLTFEGACVYFGKKGFEFETSMPKPLYLQATHFLTRGSITVDSKSVPNADALGSEMHVSSSPAGKTGAVNEKIPVLLAQRASSDSSAVVYEYAKWTKPGETLVLTPAHASLLFYPRSRTAKVPPISSLDCPPKLSPFQGRSGVKVEGKITPPEEGVSVEVRFLSPSRTAGGEVGSLAVTTLTDKAGRYSAGPLYDDADYEAVASKPGFHFRPLTPTDKWSFEALKLGKISVGISPGSGAERPLPSILMSLSGDQRFQKNAATKDDASLTFEELFPGTYYLKPLLKEYRFEPANAVIEVGSGESKPVRFVAHRTAFSVLGTVRLLGGHVAEGVTVQAVAAGVHEEAVTDADGRYRLRGLQPNTDYVVQVKADVASRVERAAPAEISVRVANADKDGVDFLVFERPSKCTITGVGEGSEEWRQHVMVEVTSASTSAVERAVPLPFSRFFEVRGLMPGKYIVKLAFGQMELSHSFEADAVEVDLSEGCKPTHVGTLRFSANESHEKQEAHITPVFPIIGFIVAIYCFFKYTNVQSYSNGGAAPSPSPGSFSRIVTRAKTKEGAKMVEASPIRKPLVRRPRTSTY